MKKSNKTRIKCWCGSDQYLNVLKQHVKSKLCNLSSSARSELLNILEFKTSHQHGWLKKDGLNATANIKWSELVINKESSMEDWVFITPRPLGSMTPDTIIKMSQNRRGINNPAMKNKKTYDLIEVKLAAKEIFNEIANGTDDIVSGTWKKIIKKYPDIRYQLYYVKPDSSSSITINTYQLAFLLDLSPEEVKLLYTKRRASKIKIGQDNDYFRTAQSANGSKTLSKFTVTKPQRILFKMISSIDKKAKIQYRVNVDKKFRVFDIYSPKYNCFIEMNGRIWHQETQKSDKNEKLKKIVLYNINNDQLKARMAKTLNRDLCIFWDDETGNWENQIKVKFNEQSISYEKAKNKVNKEDNKDRV